MSTSLEDLLTVAMQTGMYMGAGQHPTVNTQSAEQQRVFKAAANRAWKAFTQQVTATKAGARHSATDQGHIQEAHDRLVSAGAVCGGMTKAVALPIKADAGGRVAGYLVRYGGPDVDGDHFLKGVDFGVQDGQLINLLFHHGMDGDIGAAPIGSGTVQHQPGGLWFTGWLTKRAKYLDFIRKMLDAGLLGFSSGADPASVVRVPMPGKAHEYVIKAWHIQEASLTPTPAAGPAATLASAKGVATLTVADRQRAARITRELDMLREDVLWSELDDIEHAVRLTHELDALERSTRR